MDLFSKLVWVFFGILLLLFITIIVPLPITFILATIISTGLILFQAFMILKDEPSKKKSDNRIFNDHRTL